MSDIGFAEQAVDQRRVEVGTIERGAGLRQGRFERPDVSDTSGSARGEEQTPVQLDDLTQREVPHQAKRRYRSCEDSRIAVPGVITRYLIYDNADSGV